MKTLTSSLIVACILGCTLTVNAETNPITVFSDNFDRDTVSPGGIPEMIYSISSENISMESNMLKLSCPKDGTSGQNQVIGSLSDFSLPYTAKLSEIAADSIIWMINMRQNYDKNTSSLSGFNSGKRGIATILAADNSNMSLANGYAIVNGGNNTLNFRLVKFINGISNDNITDICAGAVLTSNRSYMSLKVIYIPASNTWRFYQKEETSFINPETTTNYIYNGSTINSDLTDTSMNSFGFYQNYAGSITFNTYFDNFSVTTHTSGATTSIYNQINNPYQIISNNNKIQITAQTAKASLYNTAGRFIGQYEISGETNISVSTGMYILKVTIDQKDYTEKIAIW